MDSKIEISSSLSFPISNAEHKRCTVLHYTLSHGDLVIQVDSKSGWRNKKTFYLHFVEVLFFEGPLSWNGANFRLGTKAEFTEVANRLFRGANTYEEMTELDHSLFVVETERGMVKILAYKSPTRFKDQSDS